MRIKTEACIFVDIIVSDELVHFSVFSWFHPFTGEQNGD